VTFLSLSPAKAADEPGSRFFLVTFFFFLVTFLSHAKAAEMSPAARANILKKSSK
jgi:hypothetical protein